MRETLKGIRNDIRSGRNVGIYIATLAAFAFALAGLVGLADDALVRAATLAVLGGICVAMLAVRHQSEQLGQAIADLKHQQSLAERFLRRECELGEVAGHLRRANEVWLWGSTLTTHIPGLSDDIKSALPRGLRLKVLVLKPGSAALRMAALRAAELDRPEVIDEEEQRLGRTLRGNLDLLRDLAKRDGAEHLEIRIIDFLAPYVLYAFDPRSRDGRLLIRVAKLPR